MLTAFVNINDIIDNALILEFRFSIVFKTVYFKPLGGLQSLVTRFITFLGCHPHTIREYLSFQYGFDRISDGVIFRSDGYKINHVIMSHLYILHTKTSVVLTYRRRFETYPLPDCHTQS